MSANAIGTLRRSGVNASQCSRAIAIRNVLNHTPSSALHKQRVLVKTTPKVFLYCTNNTTLIIPTLPYGAIFSAIALRHVGIMKNHCGKW